MSEKDEDNGAGCLFFLAAIIIGCAVGSLTLTEYGWLTVGVIFLVWALASASGRTR
jgi:hypothetical protein